MHWKLLVLVMSVMIGWAWCTAAHARQPRIRILTINVWDGLDHSGGVRDGEYLTASQGRARRRSLIEGLRVSDPDVLLLQEATAELASDVAREIGYDHVYQTTDAGVRIGPLGVPLNRASGLAILARRGLGLDEVDVWKLSGSFGLHGSILNVQADPAGFAYVAQINVGTQPVFIINTWLPTVPVRDLKLEWEFAGLRERGLVSRGYHDRVLQRWDAALADRDRSVRRLLDRMSELTPGTPVILAGDFGATAGSDEMLMLTEDAGMIDAYAHADTAGLPTHDAQFNPWIRDRAALVDAAGDTLEPYDLLLDIWARSSYRGDYILLGNRFSAEDVISADMALDVPYQGVYASDHFGLVAELSLTAALQGAPSLSSNVVAPIEPLLETVPIAAWSPEIGIGYGLRSILVGASGDAESFDLLLYRSTDGDEWHRFAVAWPDATLRQGKRYEFGFDLAAEYRADRPRFFGVGDDARFSSGVRYRRSLAELQAAVHSGFTTDVVGRISIAYRSITSTAIAGDPIPDQLPDSSSSRSVVSTSLTAGIRYDTRQNLIDPHQGAMLGVEAELAPQTGVSNTAFGRLRIEAQHYTRILYPRTTLAARLRLEALVADVLPAQMLIKTGGENSFRGASRDRWLDRNAALATLEARFPLFWRIGGMLGVDAAQSWSAPEDFSLNRWHIAPVAGLRLVLERIVGRLDIAPGPEETCVWLTFGQSF